MRKHPKTVRFQLLAVLGAFTLFVAACGDDDDTSSATTSSTTATTGSTTSSSEPPGDEVVSVYFLRDEKVGPVARMVSATDAPMAAIEALLEGPTGGDANLGVFVRSDLAWPWLESFLTTERLRSLLPETAPLVIDRHPLPNLRAINFVIHGLLDEGVAASTRVDAQAKSLGEWLRARVVEIPEVFLV